MKSLLDCFVQLNENVQIINCFRLSGSLENGKRLRQIYNHDNEFVYL